MGNRYVTVAFGISLVLSIWGILVYEFNILGLPFEYVYGWNKCAKTLSYSVIGGWIIFILTSRLPHCIKRREIQKVIQERLGWLNKELSSILEKSCNPQDPKVQFVNISIEYQRELIIKNSSFRYILNNMQWDDWFDEDSKLTYRTQTINTLKKIIDILIHLNFLYQDYLSKQQQRGIDTICSIPLENNWSSDKLGDLSNQENLKNLVIRIGNALQMSIGIKLPTNINEIQ